MSVFCVSCGTENKQSYKFCKNCGAVLPDLQENYTPPVPIKAQENNAEDEKIFGVTKKHLKRFVGQNSDKILPRFEGMELADSRVSWCWPAAILGLFFGFFGLSFWFFYRKMYKPAIASALIGTMFYIAQAFFAYQQIEMILPQLTALFNPTIFETGNYELIISFIENAVSKATVGVKFANIFSDAEKFLAVILGGLFGLTLYKNHVIRKVTDILEKDAAWLIVDLKRKGGVSGGMAFLGVMIMIIITCAVSTAMVIGLFLLH